MKYSALLFASILMTLPVASGARVESSDQMLPESPALQYNEDGMNSEAALRNERRNPCAGKLGSELRACIMDANRKNLNYGSRKTQILKNRGASSRRISALSVRAKEKKSFSDSPVDPGMRVDLTERVITPTRLIEYLGNPDRYERIKSGPLIRRRSTPVEGRQFFGTAPICSRRDGLQLIQCLQDLGVEVSPETVDPRTYDIYERLYTR
ncbi:MAG TPA: hypothetical protein VJB82_05030 [Candidatus Peribacterales bacterium]|nr:hypothetical protein [Candidatus Peribacterales bacterium]